jgi:hypothetical protein
MQLFGDGDEIAEVPELDVIDHIGGVSNWVLQYDHGDGRKCGARPTNVQ